MKIPFILFKYATRGRPERFFEGMDSIFNNLYDRENFHILITAGEDDLLMNNEDVKTRLQNYPNTTIIYGENTGKVQATNRDFDVKGIWNDFDILVNMADDQRFTVFGFDQIIRDEMSMHFPEMDGFLHLPDQDSKDQVPVLYVAGRGYFEKRGRVIAWPEYKSLWWDNDDMESAKIMGKYLYLPHRLYDHLCPAWGHLQRDEMFNRDQALWEHDEAIFHKRKARNFDLNLI